jgi:hypothetical protein
VLRPALLLALLAAPGGAAIIRGIVTENLTGSPLARTIIQIEPIPGTAGTTKTIRSGERGGFEFSGLAAGAWLLKATRPGFLPIENGQRKWNSAGFPLILTTDDAPFVSLRLQRTAAITGTVRDENEIGMAGFDVAAYTATQPPQIAARGKTDDRGVYRIAGLEPGTYFVRSAAHIEDELQFIPTFASATIPLENAGFLEVFADEEAHNFDLRPLQGKLFRLSGVAAPIPDEITNVTVTLAGEMGREVRHGKKFSFTGLAPGEYELYAEARDDAPGARFLGGYVRMTIPKDIDNYVLGMREVRETQFTFSPDNGRGTPPGQLYGRRKDLAGVGLTQKIAIVNRGAMLGPGGWDLLFAPDPGSYVSSFNGASYLRNQRTRPDGWNEIIVQGFNSVRYGITAGGATIAGLVKQGGDPVLGAIVFLEAYDPATRSRLAELRAMRADTQGRWHFDDMPPGTYRVFATFEYNNPDAAAFDLAAATTVQVDAHSSVTRELELYGAK